MVPKPRLHQELLDPSLAPYMGQYFQQLRHLYDAGVRRFAKTVVTDTYRADLRIDGVHLHVRLWGGTSLQYEFFTSDHVLDTGAYATPGFQHGIADSFVGGSAVRAAFPAKGKSSAAPCSSTSLLPTPPQSWIVRTPDDLNDFDLGLITRRSWQNQKFFEHAWHPNNDGKSLVTSTQAQAPGLGGQCGWMSPYGFARLASAGSKVSDFGLDVAPTLYTRGGTTSGAPGLDYAWIFWRRAAVQKAGGRQFFISTDNYGRFQIYPVTDYSAVGLIVPAYNGSNVGYKQYTPPYPSWVTVPAPSDYRWQVNDWLWRFNKDATKCVAIAYNSDFSNGFYKTLAGENFFATILPSQVPHVSPAAAVIPAHEDTPGLVEFGITITVNSDALMDFDVTFTALRESYFPSSGRFFFDAAYSLPDVENIGIAEDTLMTAEVVCTYPSTYYQANSGESPPDYIDLIQGMMAQTIVNSNDAAMTPTQQLSFTSLTNWSGKYETLAHCEAAGGTAGSVSGFVTVNGLTSQLSSAGPVSYGGPPSAINGTIGYLYALELSTLSALYEVDDFVAGTATIRGIAYGKEIYLDNVSLGFTGTPSPLPAPDTHVPTARLHQYAVDTLLNTELGMGFNVHPAGHWSLSVDAQLGGDVATAAALDLVSVKEKDGTRSTYSHKDLFDRAFGQTRDYSFYTEPFPGRVFWDQGSFRTQGIWVTFR